MRMQVTALLLVCLGAWIRTAESGPAEEFDASTAYPEDQDGSGDDLEISGSGSGDEGPNVPDFSTTAAPAANDTKQVTAVIENEGVPDEVAGETTTTTTTTTTMTSEAPPTTGTPATAVPAVDVGATDATTTTTTTTTTPATTTTQAPVDPDVAVDPAETTHAPVDPAVATSAAPTETPTTTAAPDQFAAPGFPWELPEDPLRETTQATPVTTEAVDTPPLVMGTSVPEATEAGPAETTQTLLTTQSSPTTAAPPVVVDTGVEVSTETPVPPEEEDEEEEEEEEEETPPTPTEKTDLLPASTPALETELDSTQDEMASGDDAPAAPTDSPLPTESTEPAGPPNGVDEEIIVPQSRGNVNNEIPDDSDMTFAAEPEGAFSENQSLLERKEVLGGVIAGGVVGLAFAIMLVSLMVYRMKKKDEGSYSLDEHKHPNGGYQKARREEEFLA